MTNQEVEAFILANLPATFGSLVRKAADDMDRPIDMGLQRLRRRGVISFVREGRSTIWSVNDDAARKARAQQKEMGA
jgi:DNA-binding transcriptional regulator PaaX